MTDHPRNANQYLHSVQSVAHKAGLSRSCSKAITINAAKVNGIDDG